jgi:hypothetical protein
MQGGHYGLFGSHGHPAKSAGLSTPQTGQAKTTPAHGQAVTLFYFNKKLFFNN